MTAEQHGFKAEVQQLLDLMIHAVYSNRDVFLRELISNAADALDKVRFLQLTETDLAPTQQAEAGIRVAHRQEDGVHTFVIEDDGVGMTHDEAVKNLGTIAHSGSKAFLREMQQAGKDAPKLIGQFGVGFYSCFMVSTKVVVTSRSARADAKPIRWVSEGAGSYSIEELTDADRPWRGTRIELTLREDAAEYADDFKVRNIVKEHSNFLQWPIRLVKPEGEPEQINTGKALWLEPPTTVSKDDKREFYRLLTFDWEAPALDVHVAVDSPIQYSALLFVPKNRPYDLFYPDANKGPRLYARRVLIAEHAGDLLPDWLRFVKGVVESEDISLNVSREMIQKTPIVRKIRDQLVARLLKDLDKLGRSAFTPPTPAEGEEPDEDAPTEHPYLAFWRAFGVLLKEGYYHDKTQWGEKLLPLLRFNTLRHEDGEGLRSLDDYVADMKADQDDVWYITAESREAALASPHLEAFKKRGWDVLILTDVVDEWFIQSLTEVSGKPVKSVSRGELKLDDDDAGEDKADLTGLAPWMQSLFRGVVASVRPSTRLTDSPAVLVDEEGGVSSNMERILRQANQEVPTARRHLEVNVKHPLIKNLATLHERGRSEVAEPIARLLLDDALLLEGTVKDAPAIGKRLQALLESAAAQAAAGA